MARYGHYSQGAARIRPDCISHIQLPVSDSIPFFQRMPGSYCVKLAKIQFGWPVQVLAKCIWSKSKLVSKNHWAQFWHNATGLLPVSHFQTPLRSSTDGLDHTVQNQPGSNLVLADCVRFWPNRSSLEASWCARIIQPAWKQASVQESEPIQIVCKSDPHVYQAGTPTEQKRCSVHDNMHAAIWRVHKSGMSAPTTVKGKQAPKWLPPERRLWAGARFQCAGFQSQQSAHSLPWNTPAMNCRWRCNTTLSIHCVNYTVCHKTCYITKHCTNNTYSDSSKLQSTHTDSCLLFTPKHSSILSQPHCSWQTN